MNFVLSSGSLIYRRHALLESKVKWGSNLDPMVPTPSGNGNCVLQYIRFHPSGEHQDYLPVDENAYWIRRFQLVQAHPGSSSPPSGSPLDTGSNQVVNQDKLDQILKGFYVAAWRRALLRPCDTSYVGINRSVKIAGTCKRNEWTLII